MRNALRLPIMIAGAAALGACHKSQPQATTNTDMSIDAPMTNSQAPDNPQFETLPPDESSTTSSRELQNGQDNPDVNVVGNSD
jgi:ABC-type uncharacterized transport system auxiliary subunit